MEKSEKIIDQYVGDKVIVSFSKDETAGITIVCVNDGKPEMSIGMRPRKYVEANDRVVEEIVAMNTETFCEAVEYVGRCFVSRDAMSIDEIVSVEKDFERVICAARTRAEMGAFNGAEADAVWMMAASHMPGSYVPYASPNDLDIPELTHVPNPVMASLPA